MRGFGPATAFLTAFTLIASHAAASDSPSSAHDVQRGPPQAASERVPVELAGSEDEVAAIEPVLADLLGRLHIDVSFSHQPTLDASSVVTPDTAAPSALARVFCDLTQKDRVTLYVVDSAWSRVLVRIVRRDSAHAEIAREEVAHIVETAVEALRSGARIGVARETLEPRPSHAPPLASTPAVPPPPKRAPTIELRPGLFYEVQDFTSDRQPLHGMAASLWLGTMEGEWRFGGRVSAGYRWPLVVDDTPVGLKLQVVPLRALLGATIGLVRDLELDLAIGGGADIAWATPIAASGAAKLDAPTTDVIPIARATLALSFRRMATLGLGVDAALARQRYYFDMDGAARSVLAAMPFRPSVFVGVEIPIVLGR